MLFNSFIFALYFSIVVILYYAFPARFRWFFILVSSIFFYMWSNPIYIIVPAFIIAITFYGGIQIERKAGYLYKKIILLICIFLILGSLVFFKYINFISITICDFFNFISNHYLHSSKLITNQCVISLIIPIGISYITFQAIGYLIEIFRGNNTAEKNIGIFSTYLMFFPKLISGPIERAHYFIPQLKKTSVFNSVLITQGLKLIVWGFFKKVVIADRLIIYVNAVFNNVGYHSGMTVLIACIFFTIQLYADFSGYTDMARGLANVLGFNLSINFRQPFFATSIADFWRRWHISLSTWFTEYVYNPLAIKMRNLGIWSVIFASVITFVILGLWHGSNWTFVVFGGFQGVFLSFEFLTRKMRKKLSKKVPKMLTNFTGIIYTFTIICFSLIFFRANSLNDAFSIIKKIFEFDGRIFVDQPSQIIFSIFGIVCIILVDFTKEYLGKLKLLFIENRIIRYASYLGIIILILLIGVFDGGQFIYFQF